MVKRQTVWLSTMMVLSLMLIGYYTMNSDTGMGPAKSTSDTSVTTGATVPDTSAAQAGSSDSSQQTAGGSSTTPVSTTDWFVNAATQQQQEMAKKLDSLHAVIASTSASAQSVDAAEKQLQQLQNLEGDILNAHDAIIAKGYKDCVIMPDSTGAKVTVWVKADKLTTTQAVDIMSVVSDQLNISAANVQVHWKN